MAARPASLSLACVCLLAATLGRAQPQSFADDRGVEGYVLAPDGTPVSAGTVLVQSGFISRSTSIDSTGHFRVSPDRAGTYELFINVQDTAPYRVLVAVPASRSLRLPVIRLAAGAYVRLRLVSSSGDPIPAPLIQRRDFEASGERILRSLVAPASRTAESDGSLMIGPLARGITTLALETPPFARTRLPDVTVTDETAVVDRGTITVQQPGATVHISVVDEGGLPIPDHEVHLEDTRLRSPLAFRPVRTDSRGRATFDRLGPGSYRAWTDLPDRCNRVLLQASRVVPVSGSGTIDATLVAGGRAAFRVTSSLGPLIGTLISGAPIGPTPPSTTVFRPTGCQGTTDADGQVTLVNFPPGPARLSVRGTNSTYVRQVEVAAGGRELRVEIPEGFLPVRIASALTSQPLADAQITWTGSGGRVEAVTSAAGDALLEGVGSAGGTLEVSAPGFEPSRTSLTEPPGSMLAVILKPAQVSGTLHVRATSDDGKPIANAVAEVVSSNPVGVPRVATTDPAGVVTFTGLPAGALQVRADAEGYVSSTMRLAASAETVDVSVVLRRGYRVLADVELPATAGPQRVRVRDATNESIDERLDAASERRIDAAGHLSIGPVAPGEYVIELEGRDGTRQQRVRIIDRDASVTFR